jgi:PhzF family phenazine biosynthesis protein
MNPLDINPDLPIRIVDGGLRTLIVPLKSLSACLALYPDQSSLKDFCLDNEIDIVHVFVKETTLSSALYRTRVFAPRFGYLEDPATGSGNAAFGYYLLDESMWEADFTIEQGPSRNNPNQVLLKMMARDGRQSILFGGSAITRIDGQYYLHDVHA